MESAGSRLWHSKPSKLLAERPLTAGSGYLAAAMGVMVGDEGELLAAILQAGASCWLAIRLHMSTAALPTALATAPPLPAGKVIGVEKHPELAQLVSWRPTSGAGRVVAESSCVRCSTRC